MVKKNEFVKKEKHNSRFSFSLGDVLIFLNEKNLLQPPISWSIDRIQSEFNALRRQKQFIQLGICRYYSNRNCFNSTTLRHLGSLTLNQFEKYSQRKTSFNSKNTFHLFTSKNKSPTSCDSGFTETETKTESMDESVELSDRSTGSTRKPIESV